MTATRADLRRAIIRTAALAHWRHDRTRRAAPRACNDLSPLAGGGCTAVAGLFSIPAREAK